MQLGEMACAAIIPKDGLCPFCESKGTPGKRSLKVINDSYELGKDSYGIGKVGKTISHPDGEDFDIFDEYVPKDEQGKSAVGNNAHHIIPGNASFAKAKSLHRWLAWKVSVSKAFYSKKEKALVHTVTRKFKEENQTTVWVNRMVTRETLSGSKKIVTTTNTMGNKVYGLVDYDINCYQNGVWLPSNNAVNGWSKLNPNWKQEYAKAAMLEHKFQFHDAHRMYSSSVLDELNEIAKKVEIRSEKCVRECENPEKDPMPAPKKLKAVLNKLSELIRDEKLKLIPGREVEEDWATSTLAIGFKI